MSDNQQEGNIIDFALNVIVDAITYGARESAKWREIADLLFSDPEKGIPLYKEARDASN